MKVMSAALASDLVTAVAKKNMLGDNKTMSRTIRITSAPTEEEHYHSPGQTIFLSNDSIDKFEELLAWLKEPEKTS